ncbi:MAG: hypothetical protein OXG24_13800 [Gammaproteobacteria bacterium]|nr:hypothetical protein [Gammaproteobacteria bacterium]
MATNMRDASVTRRRVLREAWLDIEKKHLNWIRRHGFSLFSVGMALAMLGCVLNALSKNYLAAILSVLIAIFCLGGAVSIPSLVKQEENRIKEKESRMNQSS